MKREQLNLLAIIAAILVLILIIFFILNNNSNNLNSGNFFNNDISTVNRITIQKNEKLVELIKNDSKWLVNNYDANTEDIVNFLKNIDEASIITTVATNETSYVTFQVDPSNASTLKLYNNENLLLETFVGKTTGYSMYVRLVNDSKVYEINKNFSGLLNKTVSDLRSTIISDVNIGSIRNLQTSNFEIQNKEGKWLDGDVELNQEKVKSYLENVGKFRAISVVEDSLRSSADSLAEIFNIKIGLPETNVEYSILKSGETFYAKLANDGTLFQITSAQYDIVNKQIDQLK